MVEAIANLLAPTLLFLVFYTVVFLIAVAFSLELTKSTTRAIGQLFQHVWGWVVDRDSRSSVAIDSIALAIMLLGIATINGEGWASNLGAELIGIGATILIVDRLYSIRNTQREKSRIISQMRSPSNDIALWALAVATAESWLYDGTLQGINLQGVELQNANLGGANLQGTDLVRANLQRAWLTSANLKDTCLNAADLRMADFVHTMLDGASMYNVDLRCANLRAANLRGAKLSGDSLQLEGALYNFATIWPDDFDPTNSGALNTDEMGSEGWAKYNDLLQGFLKQQY